MKHFGSIHVLLALPQGERLPTVICAMPAQSSVTSVQHMASTQRFVADMLTL